MSGSFAPGERITVHHRLWTGTLVADTEPGRLRHLSHGTTARYEIAGDCLWVMWDGYPPEAFIRHGEAFVLAQHQGGVLVPLNLLQRPSAALGGTVLEVDMVSVRLPGTVGSVFVRPATADVLVLEAIFMAGDYDTDLLSKDCAIVVDLGANVGLASAFFADRCPNARVIAVEPAPDNLAVLRANALLRPAILPVQAAIWPTDGFLHLQDRDDAGAALNHWGYRTVPDPSQGGAGVTVEAISLPSLMERHGIGTIDFLKVDIEGAEQALFAQGTEAWMPRVQAIAIETHERFVPGVDDLVSAVLEPLFVEGPTLGENRMFRRRDPGPT